MTGIDLEVGAGSAAAAGSDRVYAKGGRAAATIVAAEGNLALDRRASAALVLRASDPDGETDMFRIAVADGEGGTLIDLGPFDDENAVAIWRSLAASSGLSLMMRALDGQMHQAVQQIGRLQLGPVRIRRGKAVLAGRRPRFLVRRKTARLPRRPLVYREREIAGGSLR